VLGAYLVHVLPRKEISMTDEPEVIIPAPPAAVVYTVDGPMPPFDLESFPVKNEWKNSTKEWWKWHRMRKKWESGNAEHKRKLQEAPPLSVLFSKQFLNKPTLSHEQNVQWAYDNLGISDMTPAQAPSATAFTLWERARRDEGFAKTVLLAVAAKVKPVDADEVEVQREAKRTDKELAQLINRISEKAVQRAKPKQRDEDLGGVREAVGQDVPGVDSGSEPGESGIERGCFSGFTNLPVAVEPAYVSAECGTGEGYGFGVDG